MTTRALLLVLLLVLAGCGSKAEPAQQASGPRVVVVGQGSTEADVMSQLYRALLDQAGFDAEVRQVGSRDRYLPELHAGRVQVAADTLSATAQALAHRAGDTTTSVGSPSPTTALTQLRELAGAYSLAVLQPTRAQLATGFAVTAAFARRHHLRTLSDLARLRRPLRLAAGLDCAQRADCAKGLVSRYGLRLVAVEPLGTDTPDTRAALVAGRVELGQVSTTDPFLARDHLVLLDDDRGVVDAENLAPVVDAAWLRRHPQAGEALERLTPVLTTAGLRGMAAQVDAGRSAGAVAQDFLRRTRLAG